MTGSGMNIGGCTGMTYYSGVQSYSGNTTYNIGPAITTRAMVTIMTNVSDDGYGYSVYNVLQRANGTFLSRQMAANVNGFAFDNSGDGSSSMQYRIYKPQGGNGTINWLLKVEPY